MALLPEFSSSGILQALPTRDQHVINYLVDSIDIMEILQIVDKYFECIPTSIFHRMCEINITECTPRIAKECEEIINWMKNRHTMCREAAKMGNMAWLKWARLQKCPWNIETCNNAVEQGHIEILKYLHENGCPWNTTTYHCAVNGGHLKVVKYLHEHKCPWDERTSVAAVKQGNVELLKYLHENGYKWVTWACSVAAENGHLEVLKYLHGNGCPWDIRSVRLLHLKVILKW